MPLNSNEADFVHPSDAMIVAAVRRGSEGQIPFERPCRGRYPSELPISPLCRWRPGGWAADATHVEPPREKTLTIDMAAQRQKQKNPMPESDIGFFWG